MTKCRIETKLFVSLDTVSAMACLHQSNAANALDLSTNTTLSYQYYRGELNNYVSGSSTVTAVSVIPIKGQTIL